MRVADLRKKHRISGMILVIFLAVQVLTGMVISGAHLFGGDHEHTAKVELKAGEHGPGISVAASNGDDENVIGALHHGGGALGDVYRLALGVLVLWQGVTGVMIYSKMKR